MYETIVESWRNLQSFREMAELIGRSIDLHYTLSLSLSFHFLQQLLLYPCSSAVKGRGCWLRSKEGKGRGEAEEGLDGIDESLSLSFLFLSSTKGARLLHFSNLPNTARRPWEPMLLKDLSFYPPSCSISLSLFLCLFRATSLANRRLILASMHRSTSRTFPLPILSVSSYILYIYIYVYTSSSHVSTLLLENKKILSFSFRHLGKENIVAWRVEKS